MVKRLLTFLCFPVFSAPSHYQLTMKDLTRICAADVANVGSDISRLRGFVDTSYAQFALLGVQLMWTTDVQSALEQVGSAFRQWHRAVMDSVTVSNGS